MAANPATADVSITNWPATMAVTGSLTANSSIPSSADILGGAASATGTLFTVPAGRTWKGSLSLSASVAAVGSSSPSIASANAGGGSGATARTLYQVTCSGLLAAAAAVSGSVSDVYIYGGTNGATVTFTVGAGGASFGQANGTLL